MCVCMCQHDLCSQRGLESNSELQTFRVVLPRKLRSHYERVTMPVLMMRVCYATHAAIMYYFTEIVLVFVHFLCRNFSFYFVLVFWITIILVLVLWKRRPIIIVLVLVFITKITLVCCRTARWRQCGGGVVSRQWYSSCWSGGWHDVTETWSTSADVRGGLQHTQPATNGLRWTRMSSLMLL